MTRGLLTLRYKLMITPQDVHAFLIQENKELVKLVKPEAVKVAATGKFFVVSVIGKDFRVEKRVEKDVFEDDGGRTVFMTAYGRMKKFRKELIEDVKAAK